MLLVIVLWMLFFILCGRIGLYRVICIVSDLVMYIGMCSVIHIVIYDVISSGSHVVIYIVIDRVRFLKVISLVIVSVSCYVYC